MYRIRLLLSCFLLAILCLGSDAPQQPLREGKDHAVFFAIDDYETHPDFLSLRNPVSDALSLARELQGGYSFSTVVYHNPDRTTIRRALDSLKQVDYADDEQLFLFFSGHGDFDKSTKRGTFVAYGYDEFAPESNKIDLAELRQGVEAIDCPHLLLAMDACYSGLIRMAMSYTENANSLSYGGPDDLAFTFEEARELRISELLERKAKLLITSTVGETSADGLEYSPFTEGFLEALKEGYDYGYGVINHSFVAAHISLKSPKSFDDALAGDEGGNFIFVVSNPDFDASSTAEPDTYAAMKAAKDAWQIASSADNCDAYRKFQEQFPESDFSGLAWKEIKACNEIKAWLIAKRKNTRDAYQYFIIQYPDSDYIAVAKDNMQNLPQNPSPNPGTRPGRFSVDPRTDMIRNDDPPKVARPPARGNPGRASGKRPTPPTRAIDRPQLRTARVTQSTLQKVPGGSFRREGSPAVVALNDFRMEPTEITNAQFAAFLNQQGNPRFGSRYVYNTQGNTARIYRDRSGKYQVKKGFEQHPVTQVTWYGAVAYCNYRSEQENLKKVYTFSGAGNTTVAANWSATGYRLPTEAEWEYAARSGGKAQTFAGFNSALEIPKFGNICDRECRAAHRNMRLLDGYAETAPVGKFRPNGLNLYDMSGNVMEWCWDYFALGYSAPSRTVNPHPKGPGRGSKRVVRGGAWNRPVEDCKTNRRNAESPLGNFDNIGFRLVRNGR